MKTLKSFAVALAVVAVVLPSGANAQTTYVNPLVVQQQASSGQEVVYSIRNSGGTQVGFFTWAAHRVAGDRYFGFTNQLADYLAFNSFNTIRFQTITSGVGITEQMRVTTEGVTIGKNASETAVRLTVNGAVDVKGNIAAKYQDVAEWVPAIGAPQPGTVVILSEDANNHVTASNKAYDTRVAGVVSAQPGVILGEAGENKVMVATTGRVKVMVDATAAPIKIGDLLVTSDKPGIAMKSLPVELGGVQLHRPGTLVGKALEPLDKGTGEILVLLSLQ